MNGSAATSSTLGKRGGESRSPAESGDSPVSTNPPLPGSVPLGQAWPKDGEPPENPSQRPVKKLRGAVPVASPARGSPQRDITPVREREVSPGKDRDMLGPDSDQGMSQGTPRRDTSFDGPEPSAGGSSSSQRMDLVSSQQPQPAFYGGHGPPAVPMLRRPASIFDVEPCDDVTRVVSLFLMPFIGRPNLEIEAKFGVLWDQQTNDRAFFGIDTEAVIQDMGRTKFESNMTVSQHAFLNELLNSRVAAGRPPVTYEHRYEKDEFYELQGGKVRVTKDAKNDQILATVQKQRLANLDIHIPESSMDYRISVTIEQPMNVPYGKFPRTYRQKDRLSYKYDVFSVDLTQVVTFNATNNTAMGPPSHELEIEFLDPNATLGPDAQAWKNGDRNAERRFLDTVRHMLNNVRYIARKLPRQ